MTEVQNPSVFYKENQGVFLLANNSQVGLRTKNIDIRHHFLMGMVEDKYIYIQYIGSEENPAYIMTKNCSESDYIKQMRSITEGEIW